MTIMAQFTSSPYSDVSRREPEASSFRRVRRSSGGSSADMASSEKFEDEPEHVIRRLKYERDLLKHQLGISNKQKEELSLQVQGMNYSSSCPTFPPYLAASPHRNPLSPNFPSSSPFSYLHNTPSDEEDGQLVGGDGTLIPANYPGHTHTHPVAVRSAASSPTPGFGRAYGQYMFGSLGSTNSLLDITRARPPLHVNTGAPRSRGTTPPLSPQQVSPTLSTGGGVLEALDSIASSFSEAIRSDLAQLGLDMEEYENPDKKRADDLQAEVERLQRVVELERQERKGLDCRIRELESVVDGLRYEKQELLNHVSTSSYKISPRSDEMDSYSFDSSAVHDQAGKLGRSLPRLS